MKKFIGKSAAIAAAALLFAQSVPVMNTEAAGANKLTIHPYRYTQDEYNTAFQNREDGTKPTGKLDDKAKISPEKSEVGMSFYVTKVNENGEAEGATQTVANNTALSGLDDGLYLIDPIDNTTDSNFSAADAFIIQIPVPDDNGVNRDVHIYPKLVDNQDNGNDTPLKDTDGTTIIDKHYVTLTKYKQDGTTVLPNAEYAVYYKDAAGNWKAAGEDGTLAKANKYKTGADGTITITGLPLGDYYFVEQSAPAGYLLDQTPIKFTINGADVPAKTAANDSELTVSKEVANDATGDASYNWIIKADIPSNASNLLSYVITDEFTDLSESDISVSIEGWSKGTDFTVGTIEDGSDSGSKKFDITLSPDKLKTLTGPSTLEIKVSSKLASGKTSATNKASIAYKYAYNPSANPEPNITDIIDPDVNTDYPTENSSDSGTPASLTLGSFKISNVKSDNNEDEIAGAKYKIKGDNYNETEVSDDTTDSLVTISNFAPGKYTITQTVSGDTGYLIDDTPVIIWVGDDGKIYKADSNGDKTTTEFTDNTVVFTNQKTNNNFALPFTGTTATRVFTIGGICVMLAAGTVLFIILKKKDDDEEGTKG